MAKSNGTTLLLVEQERGYHHYSVFTQLDLAMSYIQDGECSENYRLWDCDNNIPVSKRLLAMNGKMQISAVTAENAQPALDGCQEDIREPL